MTSDQKALSRAALMLWSAGDTSKPEEIFSPDYVNHQEPDAEAEVSDNTLQEYKAIVAGYRSAFPQSEVRILMQIEEGDLVATRWAFRAVHGGAYLGHAPTGRTAEWTGIQIDRHHDGRIVESWVDWDKFRMMHSLGFV